MKLRSETKRKLEFGKARLAAEFARPREEIAHELDEATEHLLEAAQFDDYVPVLAERAVRDGLIDGESQREKKR